MRSRAILTSQQFLVLILLSYAFVFSAFIDTGQRNYLVLLAAIIGGLLYLPLKLALPRNLFWAFLVFSIMSIGTLSAEGFGGLDTLALTFVYALGYFAIASLLGRVEDKRAFLMKVMRWIIFAFAILSVVQMVTSLAGFPVPNQIGSKGLWSYNSLAFEPSQLGRVVGVSMLCYLMLSRLPGEPERPRARQKILMAFLATMLLSGSALAAVAILFVYGLSRSLPWLVLIVIVSILIWPMFLLVDFEPLQRFALLVTNLGSLDVDQVLAADHSGGIRLAPLLIYLRDGSMAEPGFWFGYGTEGLAQFFQGKILGIQDESIGAGFLPGFAVVYGGLTFAFFIWVFAFRQANRTTMPVITFFAIFMTSSAWNTQVFWYGLIVIQIAWAASRDIATSSKGAVT